MDGEILCVCALFMIIVCIFGHSNHDVVPIPRRLHALRLDCIHKCGFCMNFANLLVVKLFHNSDGTQIEQGNHVLAGIVRTRSAFPLFFKGCLMISKFFSVAHVNSKYTSYNTCNQGEGGSEK